MTGGGGVLLCTDLYERQRGLLQQTLGIADLRVHLLCKHTDSSDLAGVRSWLMTSRSEVALPSCRLVCLLIRLDRDPTTVFLFLNLSGETHTCSRVC